MLQSSSVYSIQSYHSHRAHKEREAGGEAGHCGATPTLEQTGIFGGENKKRALQPTETGIKRLKSVGEEEAVHGRGKGAPTEKKPFAEPDWD